MTRALSPNESLFAAGGIRVIVACRIQGQLEQGLLEQSLAVLASQHQVLTSQIREADGNYLLESGIHQIPFEALEATTSAFDTEVAMALETEGPLARIRLFGAGDEHLLTLTLHHAITDGRSALALHDALWRTYTALSAGHSPVPESTRPLPEPLEARLVGRFDEEDLSAYAARRAALARRITPAQLPALASESLQSEAEIGLARAAFDQDHTAELVKVARTAGVSMHALVCGVLLVGLRNALSAPTEPHTLVCHSPVDLRNRLRPPIPQDELVFAASGAYSVVNLAAGIDPLEVGRRVSVQLRAAMDSKDVEREILALPLLLAGPMLPISLGVTNLGRIGLPPTPDGVVLSELRAFPVFHAPVPAAAVATVDGQLGIDLPFSRTFFTDDQINTLADSIQTVLATLTP